MIGQSPNLVDVGPIGVCDEGELIRDREVDVSISRLKTRIPFLAPYIETIPGKGYRFRLPSLSPKKMAA